MVNDWYISAYEPIIDSFGQRVGMLYVGFLETPFRQEKIVSIVLMVLTFIGITALSVPVFLRWAGRIFLPLERMTETIARVEQGDLGARIGAPLSAGTAQDEIARVARHLDDLLDQVQERDRQLRNWAAELNTKVEERTRDLTQANQALERTTQQLVMSEKLAAVGEITASVAHEINNPIAVIQGNLDVARDLLGKHAAAVKTEFALIDDQVYRISSIVTRLLQFARPEEYSGSANSLVASEVVEDCLVLTRHQLRQAGVTVMRADHTTALVRIERTAFQQVLINLIVNAIHAMPDGGTLTITTRDLTQDGHPGVAVEAADTGRGIAPALINRIFDPFFTTKRHEGTGLGLSICRMLVTQAEGTLSVESVEGSGSTFRIWLPLAT